ncbi:hypothetical protein M404DRAFT_18570 [Pisolithus tinctorius Marx 270]|uniref:Uncharacterized protein n=1 Tax=Pisolithus tinctorius Marx 270 TaxID=870435 RepID=A0A0C3KY31_PISTI|nr:hypothetical protein M404DRAFT_18570 [Pisolithus tinctorius Marx 270]
MSDLLQLWKHGIKVPTELQPEGRLVCVALVVVICDKPAAHKIGGFASHSHTYFCTECWISVADKTNPNAFQQGGLVKTHFYNIWVQSKILQPNHELAMLHSMLTDFIILGLCSKLLTDIGTPASGSLMADQWLLLATVYGLIIVPQIWDSYLPHQTSDEAPFHCISMIEQAKTKKQQEASWKANNKVSLAEAKKHGREAFETEKSCITQENMAVTEAKKQEKLQQLVVKQAEKVWQAEVKRHTINNHDIAEADQLLCEYNIELIKLYGSGVIKPNHHYSMHVSNCTHNFGLLHDFWTFLFEHLNKVLKSFKVNNHTNGELEMTFFKEFHRTCESLRVIYSLCANPMKSLGSEAAQIMQKAMHKECGTITGLAALCNDLDEVSADAEILILVADPRDISEPHSSDSDLGLDEIFQSPESPAFYPAFPGGFDFDKPFDPPAECQELLPLSELTSLSSSPSSDSELAAEQLLLPSHSLIANSAITFSTQIPIQNTLASTLLNSSPILP